MRRRHKLCGLVVAVASALGVVAATASAQTTTTASTSTSTGPAAAIVTGPNLTVNAKTLKLVQGDKLTGAPATGLTTGVTSTTINVGCYLQAAAFSGAADGFNARFNRANKKHELPGKRQIKFNACQDDGANPQTDLQIVQRARTQEQDFAINGG